MAGLNTTGTIGAGMEGGRRRSGASVKTLKRALKKAGLKVSGKKATLTRRAKKAHLKMRGGAEGDPCTTDDGKAGSEDADGKCVPLMTRSDPSSGEGGRRRRRRGSRKMFGLI